jgi:hypothetical protein
VICRDGTVGILSPPTVGRLPARSVRPVGVKERRYKNAEGYPSFNGGALPSGAFGRRHARNLGRVLCATTQAADEGAQATAEEKYAGEREANQHTQHSEQSHFAAGSARSPSAPEEHGHNGNASRSKKGERSLHQLRHEAQFSIAEGALPSCPNER